MAGVLDTLEMLDAPVEDYVDEAELSPAERKLRHARGLSLEEKESQAYQYKMQGTPISAIAKIFDVGESTVYRWLSNHAKRYREQLEVEPAANLVAESLQFLSTIEQICLYEINQLGGDETFVDPATGAVSKNQDLKAKAQKVKFMTAALNARAQKIKLMEDTGIIPKEPDRIYHTLKSKDVEEDKRGEVDDRSPEQLREDVLKLLNRGRRI